MLPPLLVKQWQEKQLHRIVTCAYLHVPVYREIYKQKDILSKNIRTIHNLKLLPITSKNLFRTYTTKELTHESMSPEHYDWRTTSGSTGEPFRFPCNRRLFVSHQFRTLRPKAFLTTNRFLWWRRGDSFQRIWEKYRVADISGPYRPDTKTFLHISPKSFRPSCLPILEKLYDFRPDIVRSRATRLVELARAANQFSVRFPSFDFAVSNGENISHQQRKYIESTFGCEVYNSYGLEEVGDIAVECEIHDGLHIHEESFVVEILDNNNRTPPPEEKGRIVVTFFNNNALPFIRYDTGDSGFIMKEPCPCGLRAKRLIVYGRSGGFLAIGGKKFHTGEFEGFFNSLNKGVIRFQIAKIDPNKIELRVIPQKEFLPDEIQSIKKLFQERFEIEPILKILDDIPYSANGKAQYIIDETGDKSGNSIV